MKDAARKHWLLSLFPGIPVIGFVIVARLLGFFQLAEWQALDFGLRSRAHEKKDSRITIVTITEEDIQAIGKYPIPDRDIATLITTINQYQPRAIGLDIFRDLPVEPGRAEFLALLEASDNLVVINKILPPGTIEPPASASAEQVGFADALPDKDGFVRRSLLGALDSEKGDYKLSLTIRLAQRYLARENILLENGIRDPSTMRFSDTELTRVYPDTGSYVRADAGGEQILLNFRSGRDLFDTVTYQDIQTGDFAPALFADRVVLIGITAPSVKDIINTAAIGGVNPGLVTGVEVQAHAVSQILSAVLDGRPLLKALPDAAEYGWIVMWGLFGLLLARLDSRLAYFLVSVVAAGGLLVIVSYGLISVSWWVPVVPPMIAFVLNSMVLYPLFRSQRYLALRLEDRQQLIERTFDQIHNGPLQKLATVLARVASEDGVPVEVDRDLRSLNQELRGIYESLRQEFLSFEDCLQLGNGRVVRLDRPLHEILYEVYGYTIQREEFPYFAGIKFHIRNFEPIDEQGLSLERKREIGRFLEEAICNAGKYARDCSRLTTVCAQEAEENVIRVVDNGQCESMTSQDSQLRREGRGTQQAEALARKLKGRFERKQCQPRGVSSELRWPVSKR